MPDSVFTQAVAKGVVRNALRQVADFESDNIEGFTFTSFSGFHKFVFLSALKIEVMSVKRIDDRYYDILLDDDSIDNWPTVGDCIKWIVRSKTLRRGAPKTEKLTTAELN